MNELKDFQSVQLMNLIAQETINYYKLVGYGASVEECTQCNERIKKIRSELDSRRNAEDSILFQLQSSLSVPSEF